LAPLARQAAYDAGTHHPAMPGNKYPLSSEIVAHVYLL
jgi:hypothetical protein